MSYDHRADLGWPPWVPWISVAAMSAVVVGATASTPSDHKAALGGILALSLVPWVLDAADRHVGEVVRLALVFVPLGVANLAGYDLGLWREGDSHSQVSLMMAMYLVGELAATARPAVAASGAACAVVLTLGRDLFDPAYDSTVIWTAAVGIGAAAGFFMRRLGTTVFELRSAQAELAAAAATEERQRIAREVHDVVAHSLSVTMLHVTAARLAVGRGDPEAATEALAEAERSGRQSLADIRHTVGLLRADGPGSSAPPAPGALDIEELVAGFRAAGLPVGLAVDGDLGAVTGSPGLTLYRVVQESIANVAKHAPDAPCEIAIKVAGGRVEVSAQSRGSSTDAAPGSGLGLVGMRERVEAAGGHLDAGARDGRWVVTATIPLGARG